MKRVTLRRNPLLRQAYLATDKSGEIVYGWITRVQHKLPWGGYAWRWEVWPNDAVLPTFKLLGHERTRRSAVRLLEGRINCPASS